jgi:hypothetical protein
MYIRFIVESLTFNEVTLLIKNSKGLTPNPSPKGEGRKMKSG